MFSEFYKCLATVAARNHLCIWVLYFVSLLYNTV